MLITINLALAAAEAAFKFFATEQGQRIVAEAFENRAKLLAWVSDRWKEGKIQEWGRGALAWIRNAGAGENKNWNAIRDFFEAAK